MGGCPLFPRVVIIGVSGEHLLFIRIWINLLAIIQVLVTLVLVEDKARLGHAETLGDTIRYVRRILFEMRYLLMVFGIFVNESGHYGTRPILLMAAFTSPSQDVNHTHSAVVGSRHVGVYLFS